MKKMTLILALLALCAVPVMAQTSNSGSVDVTLTIAPYIHYDHPTEVGPVAISFTDTSGIGSGNTTVNGRVFSNLPVTFIASFDQTTEDLIDNVSWGGSSTETINWIITYGTELADNTVPATPFEGTPVDATLNVTNVPFNASGDLLTNTIYYTVSPAETN